MEKMRGPTNLRNRVDMPLPLLWPGVWKETLRLSARLTIASNRGVRSCSSSLGGGLIACRLREVNQLPGRFSQSSPRTQRNGQGGQFLFAGFAPLREKVFPV